LTIAHKRTDRFPRRELIVEDAFLNHLYPQEVKATWREKLVVFTQQAGLDIVTIPCRPQDGDAWIGKLNW